ncbi:hypothetical protein AB4560_18810 [Vibrio sp. 10N.222.51.C12]|uniref:hypothetical protein n=1 Tax=unclassified Vibrio TaxID=2614977 RepID=UPI000C85EEC7|nr:hypothetical protein [Vibrio sp. 10N.286.48.B7]PMH82939.1 hypothetical protein BCU58_16375 [Vibrio sp. 10N.286.48.B7]
MNIIKRISFLFLFISIAYMLSYAKVYLQSESYYDFALESEHSNNLIEALKGVDKLELRQGESYYGGYQQVIESWENSSFAPKPSIYYRALEKPSIILNEMSDDVLKSFVELYIELDNKYVMDAVLIMHARASAQNDMDEVERTAQLLNEAFNYQTLTEDSK